LVGVVSVGCNEIAGNEDYEASTEEFAWSMMDSLLGPATFNTLGVGSQYQRNQNMQTIRDGSYIEHMAKALAPPGGMTEQAAASIGTAIIDKDPEALMGVITELPAYKQFSQMMD
ncbi:hypothetical protein N9Y23_10040, partial [Pseudomonadales bacterium]|nr:hypothetical protein [Pseudomonadales bacterium]